MRRISFLIGLAFLLPVASVAAPFANESQVAVVLTSGNSKTESYSLKQANSYTFDSDVAKLSGSYLKTAATNKATATKDETALRWDAGLRYERIFSEVWSGFLGHTLESDKYAGYRQRYNSDIGGKFVLAKTETFESLTEVGYRYVHQNNTDASQLSYNAGRVYLEGSYRFNEFNSAKLWVEYVPNFDKSVDYQFNTEISVSSALNSIFSLKAGYLLKTDNLPEAGAEKTDTTFTTALVAKF